MGHKRRGPGGNRGHAQAGALSAWEVYRKATIDDVSSARNRLHHYANDTDEPAPGFVEAADLLDAACDALGGAE